MENKMGIDIRRELESIEDVPTLPQVAFRLIAMISDPSSSMAAISHIMEEDPPLVAKILKIINSGYYNMANKITSVHQALVLLGLEEVKNMVFALSVYSTFYHIHQNEYFNFSRFWKHSASTAKMAIVLSKYLGLNFNQADFISGLLHDFGRLVLQLYFSENYEAVFRHSESNNVPLYEAEKDVLGITHAEVGFWLGKHWHIPEEIMDIILHHHEPGETDVEEKPLRPIIYLSERIANIWGVTLEPAPLFRSVEEDPIWQAMQRKYPRLEQFQLEEMTQVFNMHVEEAELFVEHIESLHKMGS